HWGRRPSAIRRSGSRPAVCQSIAGRKLATLFFCLSLAVLRQSADNLLQFAGILSVLP
ncbi:hypothetical protein HAX54_029015, partial [Datura stramonium]|nr:hypothetical protein [Datura stramonium]